MKTYNITVNGKLYEVTVEEVNSSAIPAPARTAAPAPAAPKTTEPDAAPAAPKNTSAEGDTKVACPMPGTILKVNVKEGQTVKKGETLCVLEAMKMENEIFAPCDATIATVNVAQGADAKAGDILFTLS